MNYQTRRWRLRSRLRSTTVVGAAAMFSAGWLGGTISSEVRLEQEPNPRETVELATSRLRAASAPVVLDSAAGLDSPVEEAGSASAVSWDLPNPEHPRVDEFVRIFSGRSRERFTGYLTRMGHYQPMISQKLAERGMPQDLIYLAMIESGFRPKAYSHAHASGLWQFISETGRRYGLDQNRAVDERNDPEKATDAALTYLQELHRRFGSWYLAAAAYNSGENRVGRIMREVTGSERGDESSYWKIRGHLPRETRDYVPLMVAAARIAKEPGKYGFDSVEVAPPLTYDVVEVEPATPLASIAQAAGTSVSEIRRLNPQLKLQRTRNDRPDAIRIPSGTRVAFDAKWPEVRKEQLQSQKRASVKKAPSVRTYRVRRGDTLTKIARQHGTTVMAIKQANRMRGDRIRSGQSLRIPARG